MRSARADFPLAVGPAIKSGGQPLSATSLTTKLKRAIPAYGEATELAPRIEAAKKTLKKLDSKLLDRIKRGNLTEEEYLEIAEKPAIKLAVEDALEVSINFPRGGAKVKKLNQYVLF